MVIASLQCLLFGNSSANQVKMFGLDAFNNRRDREVLVSGPQRRSALGCAGAYHVGKYQHQGCRGPVFRPFDQRVRSIAHTDDRHYPRKLRT